MQAGACELSCLGHVRLLTLWTLDPTRLLCPWDSPGKNAGVGCSGLLWPPPGDLPTPGIEPESLTFPTLSGGFFTTSITWEAPGAHGILFYSPPRDLGPYIQGTIHWGKRNSLIFRRLLDRVCELTLLPKDLKCH